MKFSRILLAILAISIAHQPIHAAEQTQSWANWAQSAWNRAKSVFTTDNLKNLYERSKQSKITPYVFGGAAVALATVCAWKVFKNQMGKVCENVEWKTGQEGAPAPTPVVAPVPASAPAPEPVVAPEPAAPLTSDQLDQIKQLATRIFADDINSNNPQHQFIQTFKTFLANPNNLTDSSKFKEFAESFMTGPLSEQFNDYIDNMLWNRLKENLNLQATQFSERKTEILDHAKKTIVDAIKTDIYPQLLRAHVMTIPKEEIFTTEYINSWRQTNKNAKFDPSRLENGVLGIFVDKFPELPNLREAAQAYIRKIEQENPGFVQKIIADVNASPISQAFEAAKGAAFAHLPSLPTKEQTFEALETATQQAKRVGGAVVEATTPYVQRASQAAAPYAEQARQTISGAYARGLERLTSLWPGTPAQPAGQPISQPTSDLSVSSVVEGFEDIGTRAPTTVTQQSAADAKLKRDILKNFYESDLGKSIKAVRQKMTTDFTSKETGRSFFDIFPYKKAFDTIHDESQQAIDQFIEDNLPQSMPNRQKLKDEILLHIKNEPKRLENLLSQLQEQQKTGSKKQETPSGD